MKKKFTFLMAALMLLLMVFKPGMMRGQERLTKTYKLTIQPSDFNTTSYPANNNEKTSNAVNTSDNTDTYEVKWTSYQVMRQSGNMQWQKSKGYIYNSTNLGTITNVTVTSSAGSYTTYYGTSAQPSSGSSGTGKGYFKTSVGSATGTSSQMEITFTITTYTLTYDGNDATSGTAPTDPNSPYLTGSSVTVLGNTGSLTKTGFNFGGWTRTIAGTPKTYAAGDTLIIKANTTLLAKWEAAGNYINIDPTSANPTCAEQNLEFTIDTDQTLDANPVVFYTTSAGTTPADDQPNWIGDLTSAYNSGTNKLTIPVAANTGTARTAYFRVEKGEVKSDVVTITQAEYTVTPPTLEASAHFDYTKTVTITAATGTTVRYTTNGNDPTISSTLYSEPFEINATTTVKAIAFDAGNTASTVVSATYTRDYAYINSITEAGSFTVKGTVVAISSQGLIVADETGYIYDYRNSSPSEAVGDMISVSGSVTTYNSVLEFNKNSTASGAQSSTYTSGTPTPIDGDDFLSYAEGNHLSDYVVVEGTLTYSNSQYTIAVDGDDTYGLLIYNPTSAQSETMHGLKDNVVRAKGYFTGFKKTNNVYTHFTIMLESIATPPIINASNVNITYDATSAVIPYTISNSVTGGALTAAEKVDVDWITAVEVVGSNVNVTTTENTDESREAYITLTYTYDSNQTATKDVIVHQAGVPSLSLDRYTEEVICTSGSSEFDIEYESLEISDNENFDVVYYASNGTDVVSKPDWISSHAITGNNTDGYVLTINRTANNTASNRTAYFKLYAIDDSFVEEYSPLVTFTQLAPRSFTVTVGSHANGSLAVNGETTSASIVEGSSVTVTAVANDGYRLTRLYYHPTGDASDKTDINMSTKTFTMPSMNITTVAEYQFVYAITCAVSPATVAEIATDATDDKAYEGQTVGIIIDNITSGYNYSSIAITKTSDGTATGIAVSGSVNDGFEFTMPAYAVTVTATFTKDPYTWDLTKASYVSSPAPTASLIQWTSDYVTMKNEQNGGTAVNNYIPTAQSSTRLYNKNILTITPATNYKINTVIFTAATNGYATTLKNATWSNATASVNEDKVTVTPTTKTSAFTATLGNTCGLKTVEVYYEFYIPVNGYDEMTANVTIPSGTIYEVTSEIVIPNGKTLTVNGQLVNNDPENLIIEDGGQLIILNSNNDPVALTAKKTIANANSKDPKDHWYTISSSVHTGSNDHVTIGTTTTVNLTADDYDMFAYDEPYHYWRNQKEGNEASGFTVMNVGQGYLYRNSGNELSFVGNANFGEVTVDLSCSSEVLTGFNLIGNPYTHSIAKGSGKAIVNVVNENTEDEKTVLSNGCYVLSNSGTWDLITDGNEIKPNQGVLVETSAAVDNFRIKDINYVAPSKYNNDNLKFIVENADYSDAAYAWFDKGIGLTKINHRNDRAPMLYIPQDGHNYAIAIMSDDTKVFGLNFKAATMGQYTLSYKATGEYNYIHVIDRLTGEDVDMLLEDKYTFVATPNDQENRFIVKLGYTPDYSEGDNDIFVYQTGSEILVSGSGELQIFDVTGRKVMTTTINGAESVSVPAQGVYIFRLVGNEIKTQKIVVR